MPLESLHKNSAGENDVPYGHLHIHFLFPAFDITTKSGKVYTIIHNGRLTALDDPEVRKLAEKYGDPDDLLREDWIPQIPGITSAGSYDDYARNSGKWIYGQSA